MIKLIGAVMVFAGCMGTALQYISFQNRRIRRLEELQEAMEHIEEEIRYSRATLPECFLRCFPGAGTDGENRFGEIFRRIGKRARRCPEEEFTELVRTEMEEELSEILPAAERELFYDFAAQRSYREEGMQVRALQRSRKRIADFTAEKKEEHREKCRVALSLGAMGGLFLIVLLV